MTERQDSARHAATSDAEDCLPTAGSETSTGNESSVAVSDTPQADALAQALEQLGTRVVRFGRNSQESGSVPLEQWILQLSEGEFDDVVFSSAQGVHLMQEMARQFDKERAFLDALAICRKISRGAKPSGALSDLGVRSDVVARGSETSALLSCLQKLDLEGHVVGVQPFHKATELAIAETIERAGGTARLVSPATTVDPEATKLLDRLETGNVRSIVFATERTAAWLFDACRVSGKEARLVSILAGLRVVAAESACGLLRCRGVHPDVVLSHSGLLNPCRDDVMNVMGFQVAPTGETIPAPHNGTTRRVVVVGNGMVGARLCQRLAEFDTNKTLTITAVGEESRPAYDRVHLSELFSGKSPEDLTLEPESWYAKHGIELRLGERVARIDREQRLVVTSAGREIPYDTLVLATGSAAFVPPVPGMDKNGVFVYRTIDDLHAIATYAREARSAAVIGGGLLGLEAAKAAKDLDLETHVVEFAPRLMPRQLDEAGARLLRKKVEAIGVHVHLDKRTTSVLGEESVRGLRFADGQRLDVDMVIVSAGIRPRDELARAAGLETHERGGVFVDDELRTSDRNIFAIGECAVHRGTQYGLVAPGYEMAQVVAHTIFGERKTFTGADMSTKLKLLGVDVASLGNPFADEQNGANSVVYQDLVSGVYKKLVVSSDGKRLLGAVLVGDAAQYSTLLPLCKNGSDLPVGPDELLFGNGGGALQLSDDAQVCSCNNVSRGDIVAAIQKNDLCSVDAVKKCTKAGAGCGGCLPLVTDVLNAELLGKGQAIKSNLCEHFEYSRTELFEIVKIKGYRTFGELLASHGRGSGCELCKPTVASILASVHNDAITEHESIQDTNDRFLANIQRRGLYSVVPRIPGGEITPDKLIVLGQVAKKYGLYTKITGGQRVDMFGARVEQLPQIWEELVTAGFESGHAYGKSVRTVKSCVGSTWCRFGVQDSVGFAIRIEHRYKGIRSPHKLKSAVSGCIRECAEAQSKDFGLIATDKGWNLYVCGNGGAKPRHADLLASDLDEETAIRYIDRFLMYYIKTADKLTRTSTWVEKLEGGINHVRDVVVRDSLGICDQLEKDMAHLVETYQCEWADVVRSPEKRARFRHFANTQASDTSFDMVVERGQSYPSLWSEPSPASSGGSDKRRLPVVQSTTQWVRVAKVQDVPEDGGIAVQYGRSQIAVFNFAHRGEWFACQNMCPHRRDMVLSRGLLGDQGGRPKVACPQHKKTFDLSSGECLSGDELSVQTFPVRVEKGWVYLELPSEQEVESLLRGQSCTVSCDTAPAAAE
jgi:nitrite reductase (NADH) large subunit